MSKKEVSGPHSSRTIFGASEVLTATFSSDKHVQACMHYLMWCVFVRRRCFGVL